MDMSMQQHGFGDDWDQSRRNEKVAGRSLELDDISMTSEFEGGNGMDMGRIGPDHYFVRCEPDPGEHRFSGKSYYFCFAMRNPMPVARKVVIRIAAARLELLRLADPALRRTPRRQLPGGWRRGMPRGARKQPDWVDIDVHLPAGTEPDPVIVISNFHWNRYQELRDWLPNLPADRPAQGRADRHERAMVCRSHAVEIGENPEAPCIVIAQTSQPSELGCTPGPQGADRAPLPRHAAHPPAAREGAFPLRADDQSGRSPPRA